MAMGADAPKEHHEPNYVYAYDRHSTFVADVSGTSGGESFALRTISLGINLFLTSEAFISEEECKIEYSTYLGVPVGQVCCGPVKRK